MKKLKLKIRGFTLIEMIITSAILLIISAVVFSNYSSFNSTLNLSSAGQELGVAIRQAQVYGVNVKESQFAAGQFAAGYGVHFDLNDPANYYVFIDTNNNNKYDAGVGCSGAVGVTECIEKVTPRGSVQLNDICTESACPAVANVAMMDIIFLRPITDAKIYFYDVSGTQLGGISATGKAVLKSPKNEVLSVLVENTGQITVGNPPSCPFLKTTPGSLSAGVSTSVTFVAYIFPGSGTAGVTKTGLGVTLLKANSAGQTLANLGTMYDDGTNGDVVANDNCYTVITTLNESIPAAYFKTSTPYRGVLLRAISPIFTLPVN